MPRREVYRSDPREGRTRLIIQTVTQMHSLSLAGHPLFAQSLWSSGTLGPLP